MEVPYVIQQRLLRNFFTISRRKTKYEAGIWIKERKSRETGEQQLKATEQG